MTSGLNKSIHTAADFPASFDMSRKPPAQGSTMKRPEPKLIDRFHVRQVGDDTIRIFLEKGYSLGIACQDCPRTIEWAPPELWRRFGRQLDLKIAALALKLSCKGAGGCGSKHIAVFPHLYDGEWRWPPD